MKRRTFINISGMTILSLGMPKNIFAGKKEMEPLRIAVIGLVHTHVHWILGREKKGDIEIVAIVEPNKELAEEYSKQHGYSMQIVFATMEEMIAKTKPDAVTAFGTIYSHLSVVEFFAPRGIHVMVEKPLAVSLAHAVKMKALAEKHNIHLLTNYETSWYSTNKKAYQYIVDENKTGDIRKIVFHTGHQGPFEIGCNKEFTDWLTDPVLNGGGALTDFGCYGANLATWLMKGEKPLTVHCITQQIKPGKYPKVEDECTITVTYPKAQVIIQASWNWPFNVKDMEVYGQHGYVICKDRNNLVRRWKDETTSTAETVVENNSPYNDPFSYLKAVVNKEIIPAKFDVSSLENNMMVMEILEAAKQSAASGRTIKL
jgi:predicted dehydrogenase